MGCMFFLSQMGSVINRYNRCCTKTYEGYTCIPNTGHLTYSDGQLLIMNDQLLAFCLKFYFIFV